MSNLSSDSPEHQIHAWLQDFCRSKSAEQIIDALYFDQAPSKWWNEAPDVLFDYNQIQCARFVETETLPPAHAIVFLLCYLVRATGSIEWVHYCLVQALNTLFRSGVSKARLPLAIHSFLAIEGFPNNEYVQGLPQAALAASLGRISSKDSVIHGLLSFRQGNFQAFLRGTEGLERLGLTPPNGSLDLSSAAEINRELGNPVAFETDVVSSNTLDNLTSIELPLCAEVNHSRPIGDTNHYIFKESSNSYRLKTVSIITVKDSIFSIDLSMVGRPQFYTFYKNLCISDLSFGGAPFRSKPEIACDRPLFIIEDAFSGKSNICHFLLDHIPRLLAYREIDPDGVLLNCEEGTYYSDVLDFLGVEFLRSPAREHRCSYSAPKLFLTTNMFRDWDHPANLGSTETVQKLRCAFRTGASRLGTRRLLISRADAAGRHVTNWHEFDAYLSDFGFESIVLSTMSFRDQRSLFSEASHVIGVHGAGLTNILFAPESCRVMEILPPLVATHAYWMLSSAIGQQYFAFIADDPEFPTPDYSTWVHDPAHNNRNVTIDLNRLTPLLRRFVL